MCCLGLCYHVASVAAGDISATRGDVITSGGAAAWGGVTARFKYANWAHFAARSGTAGGCPASRSGSMGFVEDRQILHLF